MRSASSTCAGRPEDIRPATYLTSGEEATTNCSRALSEPSVLSRRHRSLSSIALTLVSRGGPLGPRMALRVCRPQPGGLYPSVDLRRRDTCVAKQLLDGAQVRAALEQVSGEGVAEGVRVHAGLRRGVPRPHA